MGSQVKRKILNDPVHGFINIPSGIIFDIIEHPDFQRLRRIMQLGLTYFVYPGAMHTRFHHALGSLHLMNLAIDVLKTKGHRITEEEARAAGIAILLHDIGHGPFSHTLENILIEKVSHEKISLGFIENFNRIFKGELEMAVDIFRNRYHKKFLHQLVSSQLDMDRLDYLKRDSYFTGVSEGVIGSDRIIKMLNVVDDMLVVESKGIYSIEKFLIARRLMYWQVYLHKTVICAEQILVNIMLKAKDIARNGGKIFASPILASFLHDKVDAAAFANNGREILEKFALLDDFDILNAIKIWSTHENRTLSDLCFRLLNRRLFKIEIQNQSFPEERVNDIRKLAVSKYGIPECDISFYVFTDSISNNAYSLTNEQINILYGNGSLVDISEASDINLAVLSKDVKKYYLIYPKECI